METTIKVKKETARRVNRAKYKMEYSSHDETINKIFDIAETIKPTK